jgi:hypothetical protein
MKARILRKLAFLFVASMLVGIQAESTASAKTMSCPDISGPLEITGYGTCATYELDIRNRTDNTTGSCFGYCDYLTECFYATYNVVCEFNRESCSEVPTPDDYDCYCLCHYEDPS